MKHPIRVDITVTMTAVGAKGELLTSVASSATVDPINPMDPSPEYGAYIRSKVIAGAAKLTDTTAQQLAVPFE